MSIKCLNCHKETINNFCSTCGQKTSTHKFSLQHFFVHDFVHGVLHVDKGLLFTIKELFTRPGHSIREYIQGKRVNHYNYFAAIIIILTITHFIEAYSNVHLSAIYGEGRLTGYIKIIQNYSKVIVLSGIPLFALVGYWVFKKVKQNYTEYLVLNMYLMVGVLLIRMTSPVLNMLFSHVAFLQIAKKTITIVEVVYCYWFYFQYFSAFGYGKKALISRSVLVAIIIWFTRGFISFVADEIGTAYFQ